MGHTSDESVLLATTALSVSRISSHFCAGGSTSFAAVIIVVGKALALARTAYAVN